MSKWQLYWRLSSTSSLSKAYLYARGLPPPDLPDYQDHSVRNPQSQGGETRQGYINITLLWNQLDGEQLFTLDAIVEAAITAGAAYATVDRANGTGIANDFIDVHGIAHPLTFQRVARARDTVFTNVELFINDLTIDNDPSDIL